MNVVAAFAHPDDETILIGGTLAMLASRGARVHVVSATRGEGGEVGEPAVCLPEELGQVRERELHCAVRALGGSSVAILGYVDPPVNEAGEGRVFSAEAEELKQRLSKCLLEVGAQVLISHGSNGEYGHPGHQLMHKAAAAAVQGLDQGEVALYTVSAAYPEHPTPRRANSDDPAHFVLSIDDWLEAKLAAARCHRTQGSLFVRRASLEAGRSLELQEVLTRQESLHRAWPQVEGSLDDPLARFLRGRCHEWLMEAPHR